MSADSSIAVGPIASPHGARVERDSELTSVFSPIVARALRELAVESSLSLRLKGDCMTPLLHDGAVIRVVGRRFYWPGDAVVIHALDGRLMAHRVIGFYPWEGKLHWLTQADNAILPDAAVTKERIIGKVCGGQRSLSWRIRLAIRWTSLLRFVLFVVCKASRFLRTRWIEPRSVRWHSRVRSDQQQISSERRQRLASPRRSRCT